MASRPAARVIVTDTHSVKGGSSPTVFIALGEGADCFHMTIECRGQENSVLLGKQSLAEAHVYRQPCQLCAKDLKKIESPTQTSLHCEQGEVLYAPGQSVYHGKTKCKDVRNAGACRVRRMSELVNAGVDACQRCLPESTDPPEPLPPPMFYTTNTGKKFHTARTCIGLRTAKQIFEVDAREFEVDALCMPCNAHGEHLTACKVCGVCKV
ncbi:hypothetical protein T492DRAFT_1026954 [Pavlovales sp. CCMP2436]|nr:hypothetical protein T492DRAFT_1026954 [Pavlovales sp. CCMP2436]|mmetsp:Transcript_23804/g.56437  ORF Transcript_23804/g.56437 Transcript_23804/m.56437 type:complete len:210 (-) Transcript_23804:105-734(-)